MVVMMVGSIDKDMMDRIKNKNKLAGLVDSFLQIDKPSNL